MSRSTGTFGAACASLAVLVGCAPAETREVDGPEPVGVAVQAETVAEAIATSCSTVSVKGLSVQIVEQSNCIAPGAFTAIPDQPNLSLGDAVFAYLEAPARDAFVAALQSKPGTTMVVNSMLRTVAQQYLLYQWYLNGQCGIGLAASPGASNHETGLALDIDDHATWQSALGAQGFAWFGNADPVHFDYEGPGAVDYKGTDVLAFQQLWNDNHPEDLIAEDGAYGPQTGARLAQSPADGFPVGASCAPTSATPDVHPAASRLGDDRFTDGSSAGVDDIFEGDEVAIAITFDNKGGAAAGNVEVGLELDEPYLTTTDYLIETDWMHPGTFTESEANAAPENPPHGEALGPAAVLRLNALSPGETKRVTLHVKASRYSIGVSAEPPAIRVWVKDVEGHYHQDAFGGDVTNTGGSQTFGGGRLEVAPSADVYARTHWEWDTDRLEGWSPRGQTTLLGDPSAEALLVGAEDDDPGLEGPATSFIASDRGVIELRARRTGGEGPARLYFATDQEPGMDETKALDLDLPDDDAFHVVTADASAHAHWTGQITALRLDPFEAGPGTLEIDYLRVLAEGGAGGAGGDGPPPSAGSGVGISEDDAVDGASCACAAPGHVEGAPGRGLPPLAGVIAALAFARARRRAMRGTLRSRRADVDPRT